MSEQKPTSLLRKVAIALVIVFGVFVGFGLIGTMLQSDDPNSRFADEAEEGLRKIEEAQRRSDEYDSAPTTP